jgi:hypothetical protein
MNDIKMKGRYYQLPIAGLKITRIVYSGLLTLHFDDNDSLLDLHGEFVFMQYNQEQKLHPNSREAYLLMYDLHGVEIKDALADNEGELFITFVNGAELRVPDGPFENWHYTRIDDRNKNRNIFMHGGVGRTIL